MKSNIINLKQHNPIAQQYAHEVHLNNLFGEWREDVRNCQRWAIVGCVVCFIVGAWAGMVIEWVRT